ncbi:MAG: tyrosine--tRNA ligase [Desulfurococcaceae archaeon]
MSIDEKISRIIKNTLEVVTIDELKNLLSSSSKVKGYIGFEPSGLVHIGWLIWMFKVKDLIDSGIEFYVLEATWHAYINDKLGGDLELIRKAARYTRGVMDAIGIDVSRIKFVDAEDLVSDKEYWSILVKVAKNTTLARVKRSLTIMGRAASEAETDFSKLVYPLMQVTDIFYLDLDVALGGMDQRRAHMLARDVAEKLGFKKPVAIHTPILTGLQGSEKKLATADVEVDEVYVEVKMSKSKPETCIFIHDSPEEITSKIMKAYCPPRSSFLNPILEINKYLLFAQNGFVLHIDRPQQYGGSIDIYSYEELERRYLAGEIHPFDLKKATADSLIKLINPIRNRILSNQEMRGLLEDLSKASITR